MSVTFKIDSTDRTSWLHIKTIKIIKSLGARGIMSCHLRSTTNFFGYIDVGKEIELYKGSTIQFAGTIDRIEKWKEADVYYADIDCVDFNQIADRAIIKKTYESWTAGDIVRDLIISYMARDGVTEGTIYDGWEVGVVTPTTLVDKAVYSFTPVLEALDELSVIAGVTWWIDYDKQLHFTQNVTSGTVTATATTIRNLRVSKDRQTLMNKIYIRGGTIETDELVETFTSDGTKRTFILEYPVSRVTKVEVDRGAGYVEEVHGNTTVQKNTIQIDRGWFVAGVYVPGGIPAYYNESAQQYTFANPDYPEPCMVTGIDDVHFYYHAGAGFDPVDWGGSSYLTTFDDFTTPTSRNRIYWEYGKGFVCVGRTLSYPGYYKVDFKVRLSSTAEEDIGWMWQEESNAIVDANTTPTANGDNIKVTYYGLTPAVFSFEDATAVAARASAEGGSGYYETSLIDKSIDTKEMAEERGYGLLNKYAYPRERIEFETDEEGFEVGKNLYIDVDIASGTYLIDRVEITDPLRGSVHYRVEAVK